MEGENHSVDRVQGWFVQRSTAVTGHCFVADKKSLLTLNLGVSFVRLV